MNSRKEQNFEKWYIAFGKFLLLIFSIASIVALIIYLVYLIITSLNRIPERFFVNGEYKCVDQYDTIFSLVISNIDYETYISSNGNNVIKDESNSASYEYYSLNWVYERSNGISGKIDLINGRYSYVEEYGNSYVFDNSSRIILYTPSENRLILTIYDFYSPGYNDALDFYIN